MSKPSTKQLLDWANAYVALWNSGDKQAWIDNWRKVAPGDFRMLDPVGTPEKHGFVDCCEKSFDLFQKNVRFKIADGSLMVCDNEVAWLLENHITSNGQQSVGYSIETYRFEDDGSVVIRTYYRVPAHGNDELGEMFKQYLPDNG
jgi:hypothetical protein